MYTVQYCSMCMRQYAVRSFMEEALGPHDGVEIELNCRQSESCLFSSLCILYSTVVCEDNSTLSGHHDWVEIEL